MGDEPLRRPSLASSLLLLWVLFIVYGTAIPFDFHFDRVTAVQGWHDARLNPLHDPQRGHLSRTDIFSNVLLFVPLGFLAFAAIRRKRGSRLDGDAMPRGGTLPSEAPAAAAGAGLTTADTMTPQAVLSAAVAATLAGMFLSAAVEVLQLWSPLRTTSANDLLTNTLGSFAGAVTAAVWFSWGVSRILPPVKEAARRRPRLALAVVVVGAWLMAGALPFDFSLDVDDLKRAVKASRLLPFHGSDFIGRPIAARPAAWLADFLRFSLLGGFFTWVFRGRRNPPGRSPSSLGSIVLAAILSAVVALAVELEQLVVVSRGTDLTVVALALAGGLTGAAVYELSRSTLRVLLTALGTWCAVLVLDRWSPFEWSSPEAIELQWRHWLPLLPYFQRLGPAAVADLLREVGMGVPLGVLWAVRRPPSLTRAALAGFLLGLVLEGGQLLVATRTADITDAISLGAGVALGVALLTREHWVVEASD